MRIVQEDPSTGTLELWLDPVLQPTVELLQRSHMEVGNLDSIGSI